MTSFIPTRRFWPLWGATTLGAFADNTLRMATILAVLAAFNAGDTGVFSLPWGMGERASAIVSICFTLPIFLFSLIAGQLADCRPRHSLIRKLKIIEVMLMVLAAIFFLIGSAPLLLATMFVMGAQSAFFSPVRNAVMPQLFGPGELIRANGYYNAGLFVAIIAGYGLGGLFVNQEGGRLIVSAMLIGAAGLGMLSSFYMPETHAPGHRPIDWNIPKVAWKQYAHVFEMKGVFYPMLGIGWFWFVASAVLANLPDYVSEVLGGNDASISAVQALFAIGAGIGSIIAGIWGGRVRDSFTLAGIGVFGTIVGCFLIWLVSLGANPDLPIFRPQSIPLLILLSCTAAANGLFAVPMMAALQQRAPEDERAKVMGTSNMTNGAAATIGAALLLPLRGAGLGAEDVFLVLAVLQLCVLLFMLRRQTAIKKAAATVYGSPPLSSDPAISKTP
ncbi:MFS transporter [Parvularcula sp. LCG005]|uniref:MFS transporter n=1 Tax=Parvularcula sp. LCG005 TaxID=3078805 RepID=UPI002942649C|nr:MFS transporter [Parvularcula sp. LCG005]WOI53669.1 MFS transporter [Parvularcula sp. LCG005]